MSHDNPTTNPFTRNIPFMIICHLPPGFRPILSISLSFSFSLFIFLLQFSTSRSIPTLLINKSYLGFLLLAVSSEKFTSYLTAGTRRRRARTSTVFHSLVFTHAEINFVHFPFLVVDRHRGHRDKATWKPLARILNALVLSLISMGLHRTAITWRSLYAIHGVGTKSLHGRIKYTMSSKISMILFLLLVLYVIFNNAHI